MMRGIKKYIEDNSVYFMLMGATLSGNTYALNNYILPELREKGVI